MVDGVVYVANFQGVVSLVPLRIEVTCGLLLAEAEDEFVDHVDAYLEGFVGGVLNFDLVVFFHAVECGKETDGDFEVVVFGIEGGPTLAVSCRGREELVLVYEEHLAGGVADDVVAPCGEFELLCVVGEGEAGHGGRDDESEVVFVGNNVDPGHGGVGVGDDIIAVPSSFGTVCSTSVAFPSVETAGTVCSTSVAFPSVETAVLVVEFEVARYAEFFLRRGVPRRGGVCVRHG